MRIRSRAVARTIGAIVGFAAVILIYELTDFGSNDPITNGILVLFVFAPFGAFLGGLLAGDAFGEDLSGEKSADTAALQARSDNH
jgi:hypothetical protein